MQMAALAQMGMGGVLVYGWPGAMAGAMAVGGEEEGEGGEGEAEYAEEEEAQQ